MLTLTEREQDTKYAKLSASKQWRGPNIPAIVILSAWRADYDHQHNCDRHRELGKWLRQDGFAIKSVVGSYKGETEASYVAVLPGDFTLQTAAIAKLSRIAFVLCSQESILVSDRYRQCELLYADGTYEPIGQLVPVSKAEAEQYDGWTYDPDQDAYYVCR